MVMEKDSLKKIVITGSYGAGNIGDEAMKEVLRDFLSNHHVTFLSGTPNSPNELPHLPFGLRSFFRLNWISSVKAIMSADYFMFGGGGLWAEHESLKAILLWTWHFFWAHFFRKPIFLVALSFGPLHTRLARRLTTYVLRNAAYVSVRDELSLKLCQELYPDREYHRTSDLCFTFKSGVNTENKKIAINLRSWPFIRDEFNAFFATLRSQGFELLFFATDPSDQKILSEFGNVKSPKSFPELLKSLSDCEYAIGMRLHFLIGAAISGCKLLPLSYSQKVLSVMSELRVPSLQQDKWTQVNLMKMFEVAPKASALEDYRKEALDSLKTLPL